LNTPEALAIVWKALKDKNIDVETIIEFDKVLGLELHQIKAKPLEIPADILALLDKRKEAREDKDWTESDRIRDEIMQAGFMLEDTKDNDTHIWGK